MHRKEVHRRPNSRPSGKQTLGRSGRCPSAEGRQRPGRVSDKVKPSARTCLAFYTELELQSHFPAFDLTWAALPGESPCSPLNTVAEWDTQSTAQRDRPVLTPGLWWPRSAERCLRLSGAASAQCPAVASTAKNDPTKMPAAPGRALVWGGHQASAEDPGAWQLSPAGSLLGALHRPVRLKQRSQWLGWDLQ